MSTRMKDLMFSALGDLRHEPTARRVRAMLGDRTVLDTTSALLVWEPRRVVASYAVPVADVDGQLVPSPEPVADASADPGLSLEGVSGPILDPSVPFRVHSAEGTAVDLHVGGDVLPAAGLLAADPDLTGYVVLDWDAFDAWYGEDELLIGHPRDPFDRIDVLPSSRHVRLELGGEVLADSTSPSLLFEGPLPPRFYLPREDVRVELHPSERRTVCAYKGQATYWSPVVAGRVVPDLAWSYDDPLHDALPVRGLVAFFDERVDVVLDGQRRHRPVTPWS